MALFAFWRDDPAGPDPDILHARIAADAHIVAERTTAAVIDTGGDTGGARWHLAAFAAPTRFYPAGAQVWRGEGGGACAIHGVVWRMTAGGARLLDAAAVAALLPDPDARLPDDVAGEYAVARLHADGTMVAFGDPAGIHQLFHRPGGAAVASRAGFLAALAGDRTADAEAGLWLAATGYRIGGATGWRGVRQLPQARRLRIDAGGEQLEPLPDPAVTTAGRGFSADLLEEGIAQGVAAVRLAAGDGPVELPVTGGKDSRAVLALCLAAGLGDRLTLTTRGRPDHPDVVVGQAIAAALGLPHRRDPPQGSDGSAGPDVAGFVGRIATHVWQTDGGMGGWDLLVGTHMDTGTLITGHMGEVLKPYARRPPPAGLDAVEMVRLQSPFDPMGLLRPAARDRLATALAGQMARARADGAGEEELPDRFYYRNRVPNWLGGIRGVRSHERQPVMPLGVPALQSLAFRLTPAERRAETIHWRIVSACAPELAALPFAHQSWSPLLDDAPRVPPVLAAAGTALFGNWQWAVNRGPVRAWLADFLAHGDLELWEGIDRRALHDALTHRRFDYFDAISLLGLTATVFHGAGLVRRQRIGGPAAAPVEAEMLRGISASGEVVAGHLDGVGGAATLVAPGRLRVIGEGVVTLGGWAWVPARPGAGAMVTATVDGAVVGHVMAEAARPDLAAAGIGHGRYGFTLAIDTALLAGAVLELPGIDGGRLEIVRAPAVGP